MNRAVGAVGASLRLLNRRDRRLLGLAILAQMATSLLDLIGVALLGVVGFLAVSAVSGQRPPERLGRALAALHLDGTHTALVAVFAGVAAFLLVAKNLINPFLVARIQRFLARREALVSAQLTRGLLSRPLSFLQRRSSQETAAALLDGTTNAVQIVLGQAVVAASEAVLLILLVVVMLIVNPVVALGFVAFFALVGFGLNRARGHRASRLGAERRRAQVASLTAVQEAVGTYREITVADRRMLYVQRIEDLRIQAAEASAGIQFATMLPKYVAEGSLVLGAFALGGVLFATQPVAVATGTFALFLATATRFMPALLRLQSATTAIAAAGAAAVPTYELAGELRALDAGHTEAATDVVRPPPAAGPFVPDVEVRDATFTYPGSGAPAIRAVSLTVREGETVALVGRSGAGKSTLADLILGVLQPDAGTVRVSGLPPGQTVQRWPGSIAYVPQDVMLIRASVRSNVALGLPRETVDDQTVWQALRRAHLEDFLRGQAQGLDTEVGERGLRLSGGQRQRLGIARALFTHPRLLVLDEATSALDAETEQAVTEMLKAFGAHVTRLIIAHRLSTVRHADLVVYLDRGEILASGTFDEVCALVPALRRQAALMGMRPD